MMLYFIFTDDLDWKQIVFLLVMTIIALYTAITYDGTHGDPDNDEGSIFID